MSKNQNPFGKEEEIKKICDKLSDPNYKGGNIALSDNATITEKIKYELCQGIATYKQKNKLELSELAHELGLGENATNKLLRGHIEAFSLDSLITYGEKLHLPFWIKAKVDDEINLAKRI